MPFNNPLNSASSHISYLSSSRLSKDPVRGCASIKLVLPFHSNVPGIAVKQFPAYRFLAETSSAPALRRIPGCVKSNLSQWRLFGQRSSSRPGGPIPCGKNASGYRTESSVREMSGNLIINWHRDAS